MRLQSVSSKVTWTITGSLFGIAFPIMAATIRLMQLGLEGAIAAAESDPLLWIIATAPVFLGFFAWLGGRQNDAVRKFSEELEQKVLDRTKSLAEATESLAQQSQSQRVLLSGLSEGVFYFDRQGHIASERSPALEKILEGSQSCSVIEDLFYQYAGTDINTSRDTLSYLWDDSFFSPFEDTASMLAKDIRIESESGYKYVSFRFEPLLDKEGMLDKIMVFVTDVTATREAEIRQKAQAERIKRITMAASNPETFRSFYQDAQHLTDEITGLFASPAQLSPEEIEIAKRSLHTFKGNTATFEFQTLAKDVHHLEDLLGMPFDSPSHREQVKSQWNTIKDRWSFETADIAEVLGLQKSDAYVRVSRDKLEALRLTSAKSEPFRNAVEQLFRYSIQDVFSKFSALVEGLARKTGKQVKIQFSHESDELSFAEGAILDTSIVHIVRNCIDHGIEPSDDRERAGKLQTGIISLSFRRDAQSIRLIIKDDGRGIDARKLAAKARTAGIWSQERAESATHEELISLIFAPSLSTAETVTDTSGRGVGMDAVKSSIDALGGRIRVYSEKGTGTQFEITIPLSAVQTDWTLRAA